MLRILITSCAFGAVVIAAPSYAQTFASASTSSPIAAAGTQQAPSAQHGGQVFQYWCASCHAAGPGHPGTQALAAKYKGGEAAPLEERTDLSPPLVKYFVRHGVSIMPMFRKTEISDADLADLAAYLKKSKP